MTGRLPARCRRPVEDEVPDVSDGPTTPDTDTEQLDLEGFEEALQQGMPPDLDEAGHPDQAEAVDEGGDQDTPTPTDETKADEPEAQASETESAEDETEEEAPAPQPEVNFDGFSDSQKAIVERAIKAEAMTVEEVEEFRKGVLRHDSYTRKTQDLAERRKTWESETEGLKEDMDVLQQIRSDPKMLDAWLRLKGGDYEKADDADSGDLVDRLSLIHI